jgi:acyl carrier protein
MEKKLVSIWSEILGVEEEKISIDADFFHLGGHSLKATVLASRLHKEFNINVPLEAIFKTPHICGLAAALRKREITAFRDIEAIARRDYYHLSYNQKRLWFIQRITPESTAYNMPDMIMLNHKVDVRNIKKTLDKIMVRHESFRTAFITVNDEPVQVVTKKIAIPLKTIDISHMEPEEKKSTVLRLFSEEASTPFILSEVPLFRVIMVKTGNSEYYLLFNMHHIISDGWSFEILKKEFSQFYEAYRQGRELELEPLAIQYKDFAAWQNKQMADKSTQKKSHRFWRQRMAAGIPSLQLPTDTSRNSSGRQGDFHKCLLGEETVTGLRELAEKNNTTLFSLLFSLYIVFLSRFSGQEDIACSFIHAGRDHSSLNNIVGFFVNALLFRIKVNDREPFRDFLHRTHREVVAVIQHQNYPIELVFEDLKIKYPEIPVSFNMLNLSDSNKVEEAGNNLFYHLKEIKFDIEPYVAEYRDKIVMYWAYNRERYSPGVIGYMVKEYSNLANFFAAHPGKNYNDYTDKVQGKTRTFIK